MFQFCKSRPYNVVYKGPKSLEERERDEFEEQKVIELKMKMKIEEEQHEKEEQEKRALRNSMTEDTPIPPPTVTSHSIPQQFPPPDYEDADNLQAFYNRMFSYNTQTRPPPRQPRIISTLDQFHQYQQQRQQQYLISQGAQYAPRNQRLPPPPPYIRDQRRAPPSQRIPPPPPRQLQQQQPRQAQNNMQQFVPVEIGGVDMNDENIDYDDIMLREAIRLSMMEESNQSTRSDRDLAPSPRDTRNINIINNNNIIINSDNLDSLIVTELLRQRQLPPPSTRQPVVEQIIRNDDDILHDDGIILEWVDEPLNAVINARSRTPDFGVDRTPTPPPQHVRNSLRQYTEPQNNNNENDEEDEELKAAIALSLIIQ
jgi:hypothetical protein